MWIIGVITVLVAVGLITSGREPEFFDIFGLLVFIFLIAVGWVLLSGNKLDYWVRFLIFLIGILGFIVDGYIVYITYLR
ncbi:hypothetical protein COY79_01280 [Candidatus Pacearchaeota archaeon CG_4_10_14_0_8_um_filter_35_169]|nr:MAG: hypothetical protein COY79_01280 [Candidatus Pacearchaeota archaeon CG_4_10_14_0_8_um_filter_35_169]